MEEAKKKLIISDPKVALEKIKHWCAYQERCQKEVKDKLYDWGLWTDAVNEILSTLISENFVNEERFAATFARGKFKIKHWGRVKIKHALRLKQISDYSINKAMKEIEEDEYVKVLEKLVEQKLKLTKETHPAKKAFKIMNYISSKGYEQDLVMNIVKNILNEKA